jgi:hypothetical protein
MDRDQAECRECFYVRSVINYTIIIGRVILRGRMRQIFDDDAKSLTDIICHFGDRG